MNANERLAQERERTLAQIDALQREFEAIVDASAFTSADDEHDPDGATIGFERAQTASLLEGARRHLADVDDALARVHTGTYGVCEICGGTIAAERLDARPTARTCVSCARS